MNVKDAVKIAIGYVTELFEEEELSNIGLEEATFNHTQEVWEVTVGFSRPWDYPKPGLVSGFQPSTPRRQYKVVHIDPKSKEVTSVTIREVNNA
jgi:hypothetical protein